MDCELMGRVGALSTDPTLKLILMMLAWNSEPGTGQCRLSLSRLAKDCCMGKATIKRAIKRGTEQGVLSVKTGKQNHEVSSFSILLAGVTVNPVTGVRANPVQPHWGQNESSTGVKTSFNSSKAIFVRCTSRDSYPPADSGPR